MTTQPNPSSLFSLRLSVDVSYSVDSEEPVKRAEMMARAADLLRAIPRAAASEGDFTGSTPLLVDTWEASVGEIRCIPGMPVPEALELTVDDMHTVLGMAEKYQEMIADDAEVDEEEAAERANDDRALDHVRQVMFTAVAMRQQMLDALKAVEISMRTLASEAGDVDAWNEGGHAYVAVRQVRDAIKAVEGN